MSDRISEALAHCEALDAMRRPWESFWDDLAKVVHPRRQLTAIQNQPGVMTPDSTADDAFDSTAMRSLRTLAQGQAARITPMGARWFGMKPEADDAGQGGVSYFHRASEKLAQQMRKSNFYTAAMEHYLDRGAFGTAATEIREGKGGKGLHFEPYGIGTYSISDDENGEVDTICRSLWMTPIQIKQRYGDKTPEVVLKKLIDPKEKLVPLEVKRLIRPRIDRDPRKYDKMNKAFESFHMLVKERILILEDGYDEFPVAVSRWERWGNTPYGWPPAYMALPEASQSNFLESMMDTLAELAAFPRIRYPSNIKGDINFKALGLTCYDPANGHKPEEWMTAGRYDIGKDRLEDKRRAIEEAFYVPLFNGVARLGSDATAEQVRALVSESRELFHPILANLTREFLTPTIRRGFSIMLRQGAIGRPPDELLIQGELGLFLEDPGVEYTSPMALALEQSQLANFADVMSILLPLAADDPTVLDFLNKRNLGPLFFRYKGLPEEIVNTPEAMEAIAQARQEAAMAAQAEQAAGAVQKLGGAKGIQELGGMTDAA